MKQRDRERNEARRAAARDRALFAVLMPVGLALFAIGAVDALTGITLIPLDLHPGVTQIVGLVLAGIGLIRWK